MNTRPKLILWRSIVVLLPLAVALGLSIIFEALHRVSAAAFDRLDAWARLSRHR